MQHALIVAGGVGTRLWPVSRQATPKQFQSFIGQESLLQQTYNRLAKIYDPRRIWVITNQAFAAKTREQLPKIAAAHILTDPARRNTGPAIGLATLKILQEDPKAQISSFAADHHIGKEAEFVRVVKLMNDFTKQHSDYLAIIGINPTEPNTGFGYIKMGERLTKINGDQIFQVDSFIEKPDEATAKHFFDSWEYLWNGSYFFYHGQPMIAHFRAHAPKTLELLEKYVEHGREEDYLAIESEPIDKLIVEKLDKLAVLPADMEWSDVGNWSALQDILANNGGVKSKENQLQLKSVNTLIVGKKRLVATVGLENVVVIDTEDAVLVVARDHSQEVKKLVEQLQIEGKNEYI